MILNILKIFVILNLSCLTLAHNVQVTTKILDGFPDDFNIKPFIRLGNKLYYFGQSKASWYKAFLICRSLGGFLASFDTAEELSELSNYLAARYPRDYLWWLSGSDLDTEGDFYWYRTGERITYTDWSPGQPDNNGGNEHCVSLWYGNSRFQMNDIRCDKKANYICEANKPKSILLNMF